MSQRSPSPFLALLPALREERRGMAISYLIGTASALALMVLTVLTAWAVGHAIFDRSLPGPGLWLALGGLVIARGILTWQEMDVSHALAYRVLARLRMALFDSYSYSVPGRRREHSGEAATVAMGDTEQLEFFYAHTVSQIATSITVFLTALIGTIVLLPEAGLVVALGALVIASSVFFAKHAIRDLGQREQRQRTALSGQIVDALGALREVLAFGLIRPITAEVLATTRQATGITRRREMLTQLVTGIRELTVTAVVIGVIATSAHAAGVFSEATGGRFSAAALPALIALSLAGVAAATDATTTIAQLHPLAASAERVDKGLSRPAVVSSAAEPQSLPPGALGLRFGEVSFNYDDQTPVLTTWSAEIAPGEHVGLKGPSGAGKTTILALAARLWDPSEGQVELFTTDGSVVPLNQVDDAALRVAIAMVDQETTLFHGTVRENLLRGTAEKSDHELKAVLREVGAAEWIDLADELGQGGVRLSGGQQARLCLARALIRQPRILIVDEVTASLDPETEKIISDVLHDFEGAVLIASHRDSTLRSLDRVIELAP